MALATEFVADGAENLRVALFKRCGEKAVDLA
jgi:hypothetical protein